MAKSKGSFGRFLAFATVAGAIAAGISYFTKYRSFHKELEEDFHDFGDDYPVDSTMSRNYVPINSERSAEAETAKNIEDSPENTSAEEIPDGGNSPETADDENTLNPQNEEAADENMLKPQDNAAANENTLKFEDETAADENMLKPQDNAAADENMLKSQDNAAPDKNMLKPQNEAAADERASELKHEAPIADGGSAEELPVNEDAAVAADDTPAAAEIEETQDYLDDPDEDDEYSFLDLDDEEPLDEDFEVEGQNDPEPESPEEDHIKKIDPQPAEPANTIIVEEFQ